MRRFQPPGVNAAATSRWQAVSVVGLVLVLVTDALTPRDFAHGILYLVVVMAGAQTRRASWVTTLTGAALVAIVVGSAISPPQRAEVEAWIPVANTVVPVIAVLVGGLLAGALLGKVDISEQRKGEARERELAERLAITLESISDAFFTLDYAWRFTFLNGEAEKLLLRPREELIGRHIWEEFPEAVGTESELAYRTAMDRRVDATFETFYPPLEQWFEAHAYPAPDGIAVYFRSITDRVMREAVRRESEERFRILASATSDTIWDWDLATDALWLNDGFEAMFGYVRDKADSTIAARTDRIHPDDLPTVQAGIAAVLQGDGSEWAAEYRFRRHDGRYALVVDRGHVIRDSAGVAIRMIGGMTDVTAQRNLEHQLRQSQRLEAIGQLTGGVAHDFNNLLTVIVGNTELLAGELADDPERLDLATTALAAAHRGAELTQRLLAVSRQQALDPRPVDVDSLIRGMEGLFRRTIGAHITFEVRSSSDKWLALVDPAQLEGALLNLVINARDAMPDGGRLTIETSNVELDADDAVQHPDVKPGAFVLIAVWDTGAGIAPDDLERVFDPFFTTKPVGQGTGLGLSMVYGFVKQSGGHARIYSELGEGTTVRLYLPRSVGVDEPLVELPASDPVGGSERILVVEDEEVVRSFVTNSLTRLGYEVIVADDAPSALAVLEARDDVALLFTDVIMPGMNGREMAEAAQLIRPGLRVLYTSGYTADALIHQGRVDPGVQLLSKPYRRGDLAAAVRRALGS